MDSGLFQEHGVKIDMVPGLETREDFHQAQGGVQALWEQCLGIIREEIPEQTFQTWFKPIMPVSFVNNMLTLRIPSRFFLEWLDAHHGSLLNQAIAGVFGETTKVDFLIASLPGEETELPLPTEDPVEGDSLQELADEKQIRNTCDLNHRYTFDTFFAGAENEFAKKAAEAVAENSPAREYNPLVIYGGIGTGKSHLLHSIGNHLRAHAGNPTIKLMNSDRFLNDYVNALQGNRLNKFMADLVVYDWLLFDDIHLLAGKLKTQEGFLTAVSYLMRRGGRVVVTSTVAPGSLENFNPRLIAFLQSGLIVDLAPCEFTTREQIIHYHFRQNGIYPDQKIVHFLAENLVRNLHDLHSVLVRIIAQVSILKKSLTLNDVRFILSKMCPQAHIGDSIMPSYRQIVIEDVINACAEYFKIPSDILTGISRKKRVMKARQIAIYLCRELTHESLTSIGYHFSNLHHASVLYAFNKIETSLRQDPMVKTAVQQIKAQLMR